MGYTRLSDCAPLVVAEKFGIFKDFDLDVHLSREVGWASIRDKIVYGELNAALALGPMPFAVTLGLGTIPCDCVTGLVLNQHGSALTLSKELAERGVTDASSLNDEIFRVREEKTYTFGVDYPYSSPHYLLRQWLRSGDIDPDKDVKVVVLPPNQMVRNLAVGTIDGYCVGEPWNSVAVNEDVGWTVEFGANLSAGHPEKVLMVRKDFADYRAQAHIQLIAALLEACRFCQDAGNREEIIDLLAQKQYVNCSAQLLDPGFSGWYRFSKSKVGNVRDLTVFHSNACNEPDRDKALWLLDGMEEAGHLDGHRPTASKLAAKVFRSDIYNAAVELGSTVSGS